MYLLFSMIKTIHSFEYFNLSIRDGTKRWLLNKTKKVRIFIVTGTVKISTHHFYHTFISTNYFEFSYKFSWFHFCVCMRTENIVVKMQNRRIELKSKCFSFSILIFWIFTALIVDYCQWKICVAFISFL